jgi:hypothetical protein
MVEPRLALSMVVHGNLKLMVFMIIDFRSYGKSLRKIDFRSPVTAMTVIYLRNIYESTQ